MKIIYKVEKTECWPNAWYGGPYWNERRLSNSFIYFFSSYEEALSYVESQVKG